jgi:hypothetical protein
VSLKEEEISFFYHNNNNHNNKVPLEKVIEESESNDATSVPAYAMHLVACDSQSNLVVIDLCKMEVLFVSDSLSFGNHSIQPYLKGSNRTQTNKKYVKEIMIQRVGEKYLFFLYLNICNK